MKILNIRRVKSGFEVIQTSRLSQTAVMILECGEKSSEALSIHKNSDQVIYLIEGEMLAEVDGEECPMSSGDTCIVAAGTPHRFSNSGENKAVTLNVYSPPEYSPGEKD